MESTNTVLAAKAPAPEQKHYRVRWEIDIWAGTPEDAARQALEVHRDPQSIATVFEVREEGSKLSRLVNVGR